MKNKALALIAAGVMSLGAVLPSMAADGPLGSVASFFGSLTATIVDTPEGIIVDSLWRCPHRTQRYLAEKFGDEKGFGQNVAGFVIGWPVGMVWGVPYGAVNGMVHGYKTGWEKPFSTESYLVTEEK
ncbi:MAG: hypothetical protein JSS86_04735 [Cyanobacteria bacterium SZAS LIN-2]|nr:hypothetical protein [Cyanobacteria bacterium SZAS LIN-3]MBS1995590.1 hypothetical protein [Cyanobacteria bacterium SZAS LIN-2]MBS2008527.1 hypothetical protein [Cyanobacteria bacterium SZAS TMP-1]